MKNTIEKRKLNTTTQNMTEGTPMTLILAFALPLLGGMLFQQFYSLVDTMIVGRYLGVNALAGVGSTASINFMVNGFSMGIGAGFAIPVAQRFGAGDAKAMRRFAAQSIELCAVLSIALTVLITLTLPGILRLMNTPEEIFSYAYAYILIVFLGIPATCFYNLFAGLIRAVGNSKTPVYFLIAAALINVGLDLFCILFLQMGVAGAGFATVISQLVAGAGCLLYMGKKMPVLHMTKEDFRPERHVIGNLLGMGLPMGLQYSITAIGLITLQSAVNGLGATYVAAMTAGSRVSMIFCCVFDALGSTMSVYGSQNTGAGKPERLNEGIKDGSFLGIAYAVAAFGVAFFFGDRLCGLFIESSSAEVLSLAHRYFATNALFYIPLLYINLLRFMIQGMGFSGVAVFAGVMEMVARVLASVILIPLIGFTGACVASPLAWIFANAFLLPAYLKLRARLMRIMKRKREAQARRLTAVIEKHA